MTQNVEVVLLQQLEFIQNVLFNQIHVWKVSVFLITGKEVISIQNK